jgi:hypothetical protein
MQDNDGIIYVLTTPSTPCYVLIGCTTSTLEDSLAEEEYYGYVPSNVICHFAARVKDVYTLRHRLYRLFSNECEPMAKDVFRVTPERVVLAITKEQYIEVTPGKSNMSAEEEAVAAREARKRSAISFKAVGIRPGDVLTFTRDSNVHATVVPGNCVEYQGKIMDLSAAALSTLHQLGYKATAASGFDYWMYDGETLDEIRNEIIWEYLGL